MNVPLVRVGHERSIRLVLVARAAAVVHQKLFFVQADVGREHLILRLSAPVCTRLAV